MTEEFILLHLSDLHFGDGPNRLPSPIQTGRLREALSDLAQGESGNWFKPATHSTRAAKAVSRYVSTTLSRKMQFDGLVVSGDLGATGRMEDLLAAARYLGPHQGDVWFDQYQSPIFALTGVPMLVMPGNHDRYVGYSLLPGSENFESVFANNWYSDSPCGRVSRVFELNKGDEKLSIIAADFTYRTLREAQPTVYGFVGKGKVHSDVLSNLVVKTRMSIENQSAVIWVLHYPPRYPDIDPDLALQDENSLLDAARDCGVRFVVAGHTHAYRAYPLGELHVSCAGSATQHDDIAVPQFAVERVVVSGGVITSIEVSPFEYAKEQGRNFVTRDIDNRVW